MFFEKILELLLNFWKELLPWTIVDAGHHCGIFRLGNYHRTLEPGFHLKIPFVEEVNTHNTCVTTLRLEPQTLTTLDGVAVVVAAIVKYQIEDIKPYLTEIWDQHDVLGDVSMGAIRTNISQTAYNELVSNPPEDKVATAVRRECNRYGFRIHKITFTDIGRMKSIRLVTHAPINMDN